MVVAQNSWRLCMFTRREFLKTSVVAGTAVALFKGSEGKIWAFSQSPLLRKFVAPLPGLGPKCFKVNHDQWGRPGDLWYPYVYEQTEDNPEGRWDLGDPSDGFENEAGNLSTPSCVPEFFADTAVINGMAYPYAE